MQAKRDSLFASHGRKLCISEADRYFGILDRPTLVLITDKAIP